MDAKGGIGAFIVLGALALIVAGVAGYVLSTNVLKQKQSELAAVSAKNDATIQRATELKPYADFQTLARERASTVQALASARFDWEQSLRDLSRALPSNVYLSSIRGTVGSGAGGGSGSGLRGAIGTAPALELSGCTKTQPAVATLMSRLRNVQGVTRVSLSKSEKATDVAASNGAGGGAVNPCGNGSPPNFEVVVFFEKAAVAEALQTATGDTGTEGGAAAAAPADATGKGTDDSAAKASSTPAATPGG
jgi:Tfp pilus assembly protein PilN